MGETYVTLWGNIATDPKVVVTAAGLRMTKFRLACTATRRDVSTGEYSDGATSFYSVTCWRDLGVNVSASFTKGQPVMVYGKQVVRDWETDERKGTEVSIDAITASHDLRWGETTFTKIRRGRPAVSVDAEPGAFDDDGLAAGLGEGDGYRDEAADAALAAAAAPLTELDPGAQDRAGWGELAAARGAA